MKSRAAGLALCCLVASAAAASAQIRGGTVEINPFAGYLFGGRFDRGSTDLFPHRVEVDDHATYGGRLGLNLTSLFEVEFQYSRTDTAFIAPDRDRVFRPGPRELGDLRIDYYMGYLTFNFGHSRFVPYFTVGAGAAHLDPRVPDTPADADTRFTGSLGGGIKVFVTPHFGLRFDGRGYSSYLGRGSRVSCDGSGACRDRDRDRNWLTNGEATGGILIAF
jgi:opacity protein-like surface antigen